MLTHLKDPGRPPVRLEYVDLLSDSKSSGCNVPYTDPWVAIDGRLLVDGSSTGTSPKDELGKDMLSAIKVMDVREYEPTKEPSRSVTDRRVGAEEERSGSDSLLVTARCCCWEGWRLGMVMRSGALGIWDGWRLGMVMRSGTGILSRHRGGEGEEGEIREGQFCEKREVP